MVKYHNTNLAPITGSIVRSFALTEIDHERVTVVLLNGGGQQPYNKFHKATRLFKPYNCNIISLELPGHGESAFDEVKSDEEYVELFLKDMDHLFENYDRIALFGFSLGALLSLKAMESGKYSFEFVIVTGAALRVSKEEEKIMQTYGSIDFFDKMKWTPFMVKYHREGWRILLNTLKPMLVTGSALFVDPDQFHASSPLYLIIGDGDGVANAELQKNFSSQDMIDLHVLGDTQHFDYFTRSWDKIQNTMSEIVDQYLEKK